MIDLHSHILPGIDDGAKDWDDALEMARRAVEDGIEVIAATPHHQNGIYFNDRPIVLELVDEFNRRLGAINLPLTVVPGHETHIYVDFVEDLKNQNLITLNSNNKYIFLELPFKDVPRITEQLVYDIQLAGYIPIIPHPERNLELRENPLKLYQLVKRGALTQITAASLLGHFGREVHTFTLEIIEHHLAHIIATDAHQNKGHRSFQLKEGYSALADFGGVILTELYKDNAQKILKGNDIYVDSPMKIQRKKKIFGLF